MSKKNLDLLSYCLYRISWGLVVLLLATFVNYIIIRTLPGNPFFQEEVLTPEISTFNIDSKQLLMEYFKLDKPWYQGYFEWIKELLLEGNLGLSSHEKTDVGDIILERLAPTLLLSSISLLFTYLVAFPLGIYLSLHKGKIIEKFVSAVLYFLYSIPNFIIALLLLYIFYVNMPWKIFQYEPGMYSDNFSNLSPFKRIIDILYHLAFPVICLSYTHIVFLSCFIKNNMLEVLGKDYIRTVKALGISPYRIYFGYALKNALVPIITQLGYTLPKLVCGSIVIESIFQWPGIGLLFIQAISWRDYNLIMGLILLFSAISILGQLLADILNHLIDPRIDLE